MSVVRNIKVYLGLAPDDEYSDLEYGYPEDFDEYEDERPARPVPSGRNGDDDVALGDIRPMPGHVRQEARPSRQEPRQSRPESRARPAGDGRRASSEHRSTEPATVTVRRPEPEVKPPEEVPPRVRRPKRFADAKSLADDFRRPAPVVMDVTDLDRELSRRLIDFASGLCYGLEGRMEKLSPSSFLLVPDGMTISDPDRERLTRN